jgi:hypothetical protein
VHGEVHSPGLRLCALHMPSRHRCPAATFLAALTAAFAPCPQATHRKVAWLVDGVPVTSTRPSPTDPALPSSTREQGHVHLTPSGSVALTRLVNWLHGVSSRRLRPISSPSSTGLRAAAGAGPRPISPDPAWPATVHSPGQPHPKKQPGEARSTPACKDRASTPRRPVRTTGRGSGGPDPHMPRQRCHDRCAIVTTSFTGVCHVEAPLLVR